MSKAVVSTSAVSSVARLLRSFHDDNALSRNPLVSRRLASDRNLQATAERIRTDVLRAIDGIVLTARPAAAAVARRQRHILLRYDIEGATREEVCAELGITERQLYRDRNAAATIVARALRDAHDDVELSSDRHFVIDPTEVMLQSALRTNAAGSTEVAHKRFDEVSRGASEERWRIVALCANAQQYFGIEQFAIAERLNEEAHRVFQAHRNNVNGVHAMLLSALLDAGKARAVWASGRHQEAVGLLRSVSEAFLVTRCKISATDPLVHTLLLALTRSVFVFCEAGNIKSAELLLADVRSLIESFPSLPSYLDMERRSVLANLHRLCSPHHEMLERDVCENLVLAQRRGLPAAATDAALLGAWIAARRGDVERSRELQNAALAYAEGVDSIWFRSTVRTVAALLEGKIGKPSRALSLAFEAQRGLPDDTGARTYSMYVLSGALLACGRPEEAGAVAEDTIAAASHHFLRGAALLVMAKSAQALGKMKDALNHADAAVDVLRPFYHGTYILDEAQEVRARVAAV